MRAPLMSLVHVGGGVDRRTGYHEERAALREALERGTATIHGDADRMLSPVVVTMSAASIDVHADGPNYRPPSTTVSKKECDERRRAKAMHAAVTCPWRARVKRKRQSTSPGMMRGPVWGGKQAAGEGPAQVM